MDVSQILINVSVVNVVVFWTNTLKNRIITRTDVGQILINVSVVSVSIILDGHSVKENNHQNGGWLNFDQCQCRHSRCILDEHSEKMNYLRN